MSAVPRQPSVYGASSVFDRMIDISRVNSEVLLYAGLIILSIITHLWGLGTMAMHHDESVTSWIAWRFYVGSGSFDCAGGRTAATYCYDPVFHGPSYYILTFLSFMLFGAGEAQARLPEALAGVLMVVSTWWLRPYLGRRGALVAAALLAFAPTLLYYTRFSRHDGLFLLWTLWMVIGFFWFLDTGRQRYLYLLAISTALLIGTHEAYYIIIFIFGAFLAFRLMSELLPRRGEVIGLSALLALGLIVFLVNPSISATLEGGGLGLLVAAICAQGLGLLVLWDQQPVLSNRLRSLWNDQRGALLVALGLLVALYVLQYTVFFTDLRGIDGMYQGLNYWLGSQQSFARGRQPWYYYLMLLPLYEPLALFGAIGTLIFFITRLFRRRPAPAAAADPVEPAEADPELADEADPEAAEAARPERRAIYTATAPAAAATLAQPLVALMPLFLLFWFIGALIIFSWAGEKMPWLVTHIALPGNLLVAWALGRMLDSVDWGALPARRVALLPLVLTVGLVVMAVVWWRMGTIGAGQQGQADLLQLIIPIAVIGMVVFSVLTIGQDLGARVTLILCALTFAGVIGAYMVRATWMVVYQHPDTPIELLVYTQTAPDVPLIVEEVRELAINQTRNRRSAEDPAGGLTMPVVIDQGSQDGEGYLGWPLQWYFRDFQRLEYRGADVFTNATADTFKVAIDSNQPDITELAPVIMVSSQHVSESARQELEESYTLHYDTVFNWWFPEGDRCDPSSAGYKRFYYSQQTFAKAQADPDCASRATDINAFGSVLAPLVWPFQAEHRTDIWNYLIYRELPEEVSLGAREMQVWVRSDLLAGSGAAGGSREPLRLVAQASFGATDPAQDQLNMPRGVVIDEQGRVYVADTFNHRVVVYNPDGSVLRTVGSFGTGELQFNEPRALALDAQNNLYVADTWNARVVKLDSQGRFVAAWGEGKQDFGQNGQRVTMTDRTQAGNEAEPLGFFGPRGLAIDSSGNVYIADTGNRRVVVTDDEGNYQYQWGYEGAAPGSFNEPVDLALDPSGNVYVADVWNGRVQMFAPGPDGRVSPAPAATWDVPGWAANTYDDPSIAVDANGQVYVSVPSAQTVLLTGRTGEIGLRWGGTGTDMASLNGPSGLGVSPEGDVYVVDRNNRRVLRFVVPQVRLDPAQQ